METRNSAYQHFAGNGVGTVTFTRSVQMIILTVSGTATISFDGGATFMPIGNGTYQFTNLHVKNLDFGAGTWDGVGLAL